jgi:predicted nucleic acid-binding protein
VDKNRKQAIAVLKIIKWARRHGIPILGSAALDAEIGQIAASNPVKYAKVWGLYKHTITGKAEFVDTAFDYVEPIADAAGIAGLDIHHLAFAVGAGVDYLITTDEGFIASASNLKVSVRVINPLAFSAEKGV